MSAPAPRWLVPAALLLGAAAAVLVAWGDRAGLADGLPGYFNDDGAQAIYLHDAVHDALRAGRLTLRDPNQFWPFGIAYAPMHGANVLEMLLSGLFRLVLPWPWWLSASAYAWIALNAAAFAPLGWHLWRRAGPTFAGALCWALLPAGLEQIAAGRLTQVALVGVPFAVLGLLRIAEGEDRRAPWIAGLGIALTAIGYWFNGLFLATVAPLFALWGARRRGVAPVARDLAKAAAVALLGVSPLLAVVGASVLDGATLAAPMDPSWMSPVFPDALRLAGEQPAGLRGWFPWVFGVGLLATLARGERRLLWLGATALCLVFALGPGQSFDGRTWLLPYYPLWKWVPIYGRMYHPDRWVLIAGVFLVVAAVDGLARLRPVAAWALPVGLVVQLFAGGTLPLGTWRLPRAEVWEAVSTDARRGAVVVLPLTQAAISCARQPFHGRPILGGMVENQPLWYPPAWQAYVESSPLLMDLWRAGRGKPTTGALWQADLDRLRADGFDTVVLDVGAWRRAREAAGIDGVSAVSAVLGPPERRFADGALWRIPTTGRPGALPAATDTLALPDPPPPDTQGGKGRAVAPRAAPLPARPAPAASPPVPAGAGAPGPTGAGPPPSEPRSR